MNLRLIIPHSRVLCYDCFGIAAKQEGSVRLRPDPPAMKGILGAGRIIAAGIPGWGIPVPRPSDPSKKVSVQSCGQNRYRGGYPYPPRAPRAKNGVRGRETPSPSPEPRRRCLLSCVQAAPPAGYEPRTLPAGTVRGVVPLHPSPGRHRDRVPDQPLHAAEADDNRGEIPPIPPLCCHTFVLLHTRLNSYRIFKSAAADFAAALFFILFSLKPGDQKSDPGTPSQTMPYSRYSWLLKPRMKASSVVPTLLAPLAPVFIASRTPFAILTMLLAWS